MKQHLITTLATIAISGLSLPVEARAESSSDVHPKSVVGCWTRRIKEPDAQNLWPHIVSYCLKSNGGIHAFAYEHGDGWDFSGKWLAEANKLTLIFYEKGRDCKFSISEERDILTMTDCDLAGVYTLNKNIDADTMDEP